MTDPQGVGAATLPRGVSGALSAGGIPGASAVTDPQGVGAETVPRGGSGALSAGAVPGATGSGGVSRATSPADATDVPLGSEFGHGAEPGVAEGVEPKTTGKPRLRSSKSTREIAEEAADAAEG